MLQKLDCEGVILSNNGPYVTAPFPFQTSILVFVRRYIFSIKSINKAECVTFYSKYGCLVINNDIMNDLGIICL